MKLSNSAQVLSALFILGGLSVSATRVFAESDVTPPTVKCSVRKDLLWPPNHRFVDVGLKVEASDDGGDVVPNSKGPNLKGVAPDLQVSIFADEDDEEATGDGRHSPDAKPDHTFAISPGNNQPLRLRRERKGNSDGRVYLIVVEARDAAGNTSQDCCTVVVPRNNSKQGRAKVARQAKDALAFFKETQTLPAGFVPVGDGAVIGSQK